MKTVSGSIFFDLLGRVWAAFFLASQFGALLLCVWNGRNGSALPSSNPRKSRAEEMRAGLSMLNNVTIAFYGKVEDQFGDPIANAEITGSIIYARDAYYERLQWPF